MGYFSKYMEDSCTEGGLNCGAWFQRRSLVCCLDMVLAIFVFFILFLLFFVFVFVVLFCFVLFCGDRFLYRNF